MKHSITMFIVNNTFTLDYTNQKLCDIILIVTLTKKEDKMELDKTEKRHCTVCVYMGITLIYLLVLSLAIPNLEREFLRDGVGFFTAFVSFIGMIRCAYFAHRVWYIESELTRLVRDVYIATSAMFFATFGMGILGVLDSPQLVWDIVYYFRLLPVTFEVVALIRLFNFLMGQHK